MLSTGPSSGRGLWSDLATSVTSPWDPKVALALSSFPGTGSDTAYLCFGPAWLDLRSSSCPLVLLTIYPQIMYACFASSSTPSVVESFF